MIRRSILAGALLPSLAWGQATQVLHLSGTGSDDTVDWEFKVNGGRRSGVWSTIPVPSNWEMQGFGTYRYWDDWSEDPAPDRVGEYRHGFTVPDDWRGRKVELVFGGSMTDTEVHVNGQPAGPVHQGGFYPFRYDVTDLLAFGEENLLEVTVHRFSSNESVNRAERQADYWLFSGIYRPVWLEAVPAEHIRRIAVDARHDGEFRAEVFLRGVTSASRLTAQIEQRDGRPVGQPFSLSVDGGQERAVLKHDVTGVEPWSAEWPNLYRVRMRLERDGTAVHEVAETFGFRTVEVRPGDGLYVNGAKARLKGVNRHTFWPTTGRATSKALSVADAQLIKDMNMNAVRMSHYPPDPHFLDACDELGLFVIDELAGWQAAYDTQAGIPLVREMVTRDVNHPSVILWANGNEGGWNPELVDEYARWDPQRRTVIHPWLNFNGINTAHYEVYDCCAGSFFHGHDVFMPTEFLHGLFDGGHGAGLEDWWNRMLDHPLAAGGFLWAFADEGIVREDRDGAIDVAGNSAPDGIVGPFREKEGSFFTIKEIWSPVYLPLSELDRLPPTFTGALQVENRYDLTDLDQVRFDWRLIDFPGPMSGDTGHTVMADGSVQSPSAPPGGIGVLDVDLPADWAQHDAFALTATDPHDREIYTWTWMIKKPETVADAVVDAGEGQVAGRERDGVISMTAGDLRIDFDSSNGRLRGISRGGAAVSLHNGPRLVTGDAVLHELTHGSDGSDYIVEASFDGNLKFVRWRLLPSGWLRLHYAYRFDGHSELPFLGVTFDYPEDRVTDLRWLGKGPYRVWKNRRRGVEFNVWEKAYNNTVTGWSWEYPEFKGFHEDLYWATLGTRELPITMVAASSDLYLRVFTPAEADDPRTTHVEFPPGDLSFLHGIPPIGTKFHPAAEHGPAGAQNTVSRLGGWYEGIVFFYFGDP